MLSCFRHAWLFVTLWTLVLQAPLFMGFSRQEYWSGFPCPPPGDLSNPGIKIVFLTSVALAGGFFTTSATCHLHKWLQRTNRKKPMKTTQLRFYRVHVCSVTQSCPTLCSPVDCSIPGSSVHGILQARILEWVSMPSSRESSWARDQTCISYIPCIGRQVQYLLQRKC